MARRYVHPAARCLHAGTVTAECPDDEEGAECLGESRSHVRGPVESRVRSAMMVDCGEAEIDEGGPWPDAGRLGEQT